MAKELQQQAEQHGLTSYETYFWREPRELKEVSQWLRCRNSRRGNMVLPCERCVAWILLDIDVGPSLVGARKRYLRRIEKVLLSVEHDFRRACSISG